MTVITKPITEKKVEKLDQPLVENEQNSELPPKIDLEAATEPQYFILRTRSRRVSSATTVCLFLTALLVMSIGVIGGVYLYRQFAKSKIQRFHGWCSFPYEDSALFHADHPTTHNQIKLQDSDSVNQMTGFLKEEFEMDLESDDYEKIDVPDFRGGRRGRFIHDFKVNKTGIIDVDYHRCFVMPLNRHRVLPPRSLFDLVKKMWDGYYDVDTEIVRETMRVVTPPISDLKTVGVYISHECKNYRTYMLEKVPTPTIWKRSISDNIKFAEFAGNKITELEITNFGEVLDYETQNAVGA